MKKAFLTGMAIGMVLLLSGPAAAHWRPYFGVGIILPPPPIFWAPPPVYYPNAYPPNEYVAPHSYDYRYRVWIPGHWEKRWGPYGWERVWIPGHWQYRR